MQCVVRLLQVARDRVFGTGGDSVVLRHETSGVVLTSGQGHVVRFESADAASAFCRRFLDEAPAWRPVPAPAAPARAA